MNKSELVDAIAKDTGLSKKDSEAALKSIIENISKELSKGHEVALIGFGTFAVGKRAARSGRNPKTGETIKEKEEILQLVRQLKFQQANVLNLNQAKLLKTE